MLDTIPVSLAIAAGVIALAGVPLRCWRFATGRLRSRIPHHAIARATLSLFPALSFIPTTRAWAYAVYAACVSRGVRSCIDAK